MPLKVVYDIEDFEVPKGIEDHLFRITQEGISNTLRHAEGSKLTIDLFNKDDYLLLRIQDDGKGFDVDEKWKKLWIKKYARTRIRNRSNAAYCILARCRTRIEVKAPLNKEESMTIKVLFVDDHEMVRIGISSYLSTQPDIEVVGKVNLERKRLKST